MGAHLALTQNPRYARLPTSPRIPGLTGGLTVASSARASRSGGSPWRARELAVRSTLPQVRNLGSVKLDTQSVKIGKIAGREDEIARQAGGGDQSVHRAEPAAGVSRSRQQAAAGVGDFLVHSHDSPREARRQLLAKPLVEPGAAATRSQPFDPEADFGQADDAQENAVLIHLVQPAHDCGIGPRPDPFGNDIGVDQPAPAHNSTSRAPPGARSFSTCEPRSGECAKNSASVPLRAVLRVHSSTETITTAGRPFLVIACGPWLIARPRTSLNRALAWATDQTAPSSDMFASTF